MNGSPAAGSGSRGSPPAGVFVRFRAFGISGNLYRLRRAKGKARGGAGGLSTHGFCDIRAPREPTSGGYRMTSLIIEKDRVMDILRRTGAYREGHFEYPSGYHTPYY